MLQTYRDTPADFDYTQADFLPLLSYNLDRFKPKEDASPEKQAGPVEMN
jgi:hypothetical protein